MCHASSPQRRPLRSLFFAAFVVLAALLASPSWGQSGPAAPHTATFYRQPPVFVENRGQWVGDFLYKTRVGAMTVFVEKSGWTFTIEERKETPTKPDSEPMSGKGTPKFDSTRGVAVRMRPAGS